MAGKSFRKGIGIIELLEMFPDDDAAQKWFESIRWPNGRPCAKCGSERTREVPNAKPMPYRRSGCRRQYFSVKPGTVIESSIPPPITMISDSPIQHPPRGNHYTAAGRQRSTHNRRATRRSNHRP